MKKNPIFTSKRLFIISFLFSTISYSQEIKSKSTSSIGENNVYFIKNKVVPKDELVKIKPEDIESVNVVKRDTIIDKQRYTGQIFVVLKPSKTIENSLLKLEK
jgi:hypothetical protein